MHGNLAYTLRFPAPENHLVEVELVVTGAGPTSGAAALELRMATWTPGSYLIREYSRQIENLTAEDAGGRPLPVVKTQKNRWRVESGGADPVRVRYRVYSRELTVRTNFVSSELALLNGAATFLTPVGAEHLPHEVHVVLPPAWKAAVSPLPSVPGAGGEPVFRADDFAALVDAPLLAGSPRIHEFTVAGKSHRLVDAGEPAEGSVWNSARAAADLEKIVREEIAFWGGAPYPHYIFFNLVTEESGGLEHRDSTVLMTSPWRSRTRKGHLDWLALASHELFHAWNVKRLRPAEFDHFDYEQETYTRSLWVVEGLTAYYDDLLVARAGISTPKELLDRLSQQIDRLQNTPGRLAQPLSETSFDAWIKQYRRDENSNNTTVSYYLKGAVVGFLLDAEIRRASQGARSLDDALRLAWSRYSGERGYTQEEFRRLASETAGTDLGGWFSAAVDGTGDLDYAPALRWLGLRFAPEKERRAEDTREEPAGWLGLETALRGGRLMVTEVRRDGPGYPAGINVDDEILAIGEYRVPPEGWQERLKNFRPGEAASLLVARRERLLRLPVTFGRKPQPWKLEIDPAATPEQKAHFADWLKSSAG